MRAGHAWCAAGLVLLPGVAIMRAMDKVKPLPPQAPGSGGACRNRNDEYVPLMCALQSAISRELAYGDSRVPGVNALLLIRCRQCLNGGRIENARAGFLCNELERGGAFLSAKSAAVVLAGDRPPFWHWEGETLVVDSYSRKAEERFLKMRNGGRKGGRASARGRKAAAKPPCNPPANHKETNTPLREHFSKGTPPPEAGSAFEGMPSTPATSEAVSAGIARIFRDLGGDDHGTGQ